MNGRAAIVGLIVLATAGFVVGTTIERHNSHHGSAGLLRPEARARAEGSGESAAQHAAEGATSTAAGDIHQEVRPLGVDIEAVPFIVLAGLASLALAAAGWARAGSRAVLGVVAAAMLLFAALDVREVVHQIDESRTGLAVLAGVVAALHLAAAAVAGLLVARRGGRAAGTMPA
jgi:hypothetical protein